MPVKPEDFSTLNNIAGLVNSWFSLKEEHYVTGRGLMNAVKNGMVGKRPTKKGMS